MEIFTAITFLMVIMIWVLFDKWTETKNKLFLILIPVIFSLGLMVVIAAQKKMNPSFIPAQKTQQYQMETVPTWKARPL